VVGVHDLNHTLILTRIQPEAVVFGAKIQFQIIQAILELMHVPAANGTFAVHITFTMHQRTFELILVKGHILELVEFVKIKPHASAVGTVVHLDHPLIIFPGQRAGAFGANHYENSLKKRMKTSLLYCLDCGKFSFGAM
jgi:hypothetical protein